MKTTVRINHKNQSQWKDTHAEYNREIGHYNEEDGEHGCGDENVVQMQGKISKGV